MKQFAKSALAILAVIPAPALAQPQASEQIIVPSPYVVQKTNAGPTHTRTVTISQAVPAGDLDLKTGEGMAKLEGRVKQAAAGVCRQMDDHYPTPAYTGETVNNNCVATATRQAMAKVPAGAPVTRTAQGAAPATTALAMR